MDTPSKVSLVAAITLIAIAGLATPLKSEPGPPTPAPTDTSSDKKGDRKSKPKALETTSLDGYREAYQTIYERNDYARGIALLRQLDRDDDADVANLIGFASRKLGRYEDARHWYERALATDPKHVRTWQYYGMWHAEQGNFLKASEHLDAVRALCGTECREYAELKGAIEGVKTY